MVEVGIDLLARRGLTVGLETIKFDDAVVEADVPRASAYRAWSSDGHEGPQLRFHDALTERLLVEQPGFGWGDRDDPSEGSLSATLDAVRTVLDEMPDLDGLDPGERGFWFRQVHRAGSDANQYSMDDSKLWQCYVAVAAGLMSQEHVDQRLLDAWRIGEDRLVERYRDLYSTMAATFGLRLRAAYTYEQFDTAAAALAEGLTIRSSINPHTRGIVRPTGPDGGEQEWTLFAVCFEGLVRQFFEPVDDPPFTDLHDD